MLSIPAKYLRALSGIYPRSLEGRSRGINDLGIQRRHEQPRSKEIGQYIKYGFPWSDLSEAKRRAKENDDLRKPGWLPTAIVVNILEEGDERLGKQIKNDDLVRVVDQANNTAKMQLPSNFVGADWRYKTIPPIEVIDGQHRLWAFEESKIDGDFELPVVAFVGLDISWQAYLFYTINIKPKKINTSLAFDLYPLLRTEDWLEKFEGPVIYREARAQELVDQLYSHPESPWYRRINMLGESGNKGKMISQAAWVRSLLATYIRSWEGPIIKIGGLFGAPVGSHRLTLPWSLAEQAAFIIVVGQLMKEAVANYSGEWAQSLRTTSDIPITNIKDDLAFFGPQTLLNQDQGIRALLHITNDLLYVRADELKLILWGGKNDNVDGNVEEVVASAIRYLKQDNKIKDFLKEIAQVIAEFDWRASSAPGLSDDQKTLRAAFRGSGGYRELRRYLLKYVVNNASPTVANAAKEVIRELGYQFDGAVTN